MAILCGAPVLSRVAGFTISKWKKTAFPRSDETSGLHTTKSGLRVMASLHFGTSTMRDDACSYAHVGASDFGHGTSYPSDGYSQHEQEITFEQGARSHGERAHTAHHQPGYCRFSH